MGNILISLGSVIREKGLFKEIEPLSEKTFFLVEKKHNYLYSELIESQKIYFERNLLKKKESKFNANINLNLIYKITDEILKDQNSYLILSRRKLNYYEYSPMRLKDIIVNLINKSINIILDKKLEYFIIHNTPHSENWFLFRTAELMGKKIFIIRESIFPGYSRFHFGLKNQKIINSGGDKSKFKKKLFDKFFKEKTKKRYIYPKLQNDRKSLYSNNYSGLIPEIRFFFKEDSFNFKRTIKAKLAVIKTAIYKQDSLSFYQKKVSVYKKLDLKSYSPYAVFFLHYQPERTSIPEANSFSFQYKTILFLKKLLPKAMNLLIKEHPDAYRNKFSPRFKSIEAYKNIISIPGIFFCDMDLDPFSIIDDATLVATLTGNVGIESICRGKKIIYFGNPIYKDYPHAINGSDNLTKSKLNKFIENNKLIGKDSIEHYLKNYFSNSYKNNFENFSTNLLNFLINNIDLY